ncbi:hypothetical protein [Atopobacter phocae]|uniref:hypothetical protein n=1 Tax=Atopobacter phocae TaxID=136492 RepID=UPI00046EE737|nr:hypothetical protein [Atopobacter phocae]
MSMELFESLYHPKWRQLSAQQKMLMITQLLRVYVNPLLAVEKIELKQFSMGGIKTETISAYINQREFVFVPGQRQVILGWDVNDNIQSTPSEFLTQSSKQMTAEEKLKRDYLLHKNLSKLRQVDIDPMFVQVEAELIGYQLIGQMNVVTGRIDIDSNHDDLKSEIRQVCEEQMHSLYSMKALSSHDSNIRKGQRIMAKLQEDGDNYHLYLAQPTLFKEIRRKVDYLGMELMSEDEWEYALSAGLRYLFRNRTNWPLNDELFDQLLQQRNMFGLKMNDPALPFELTDQPGVLKGGMIDYESSDVFVKYMKQMNYYRYIDMQMADELDSYLLQPGSHTYRPIIRLTLPE